MTKTFADLLNEMSDGKAAIKAAIESKGVSLGNAKFGDLAAKILQIPTLDDPIIGKQDITPSATDQAISKGIHDGTGVVAGDADLIPENIKEGASIFGVTGSFAGGVQITGTIDRNVKLAEAIEAGDTIAVRGRVVVSGQAVDTADPDVAPANSSNGVAMSSDGQYLAVGHWDSPYLTTYKWNSSNNRYEKTAVPDVAPTGIGRCVSMSSDGQYLAAGHETAPYLTTYKWNSSNNRYEKTAVPDTLPTAYLGSVTMSSDGQYLAIGFGTSLYSYKWNSENSRYQKTADAYYTDGKAPLGTAVKMSSDGQYLAISSSYSHQVESYKWNSENNRYQKTALPNIAPAGACNGIAMSSDGQYLAVAHTNSPYLTTYAWNAGNNRYEKIALQPAKAPSGTGKGVDMSSDGNFMAVGHGGYSTNPIFLITYRHDLTHTLKAEKFTPGQLTLPTDFTYMGIMNEAGDADEIKSAKMIFWTSDPLATLDP